MIEFINYPDGTFYPQIKEFESEITFKINSYSDLWKLRQIKDVYDANRKPLSVTIPCIIDGQADRRFNDNESANLRLVCQFINSMKFEQVSVFHPHNPEVIEALIDNVEIIDNTSFITNVLGRLIEDNKEKLKNMVLLSTDAGGFKPLMKLADRIFWKGEVFAASKSRSWDGNASKLTQQIDKEDFEGKSILIVDDLCVYGGTFIGLSKLLKNRNIGNLYLATSHLTVTAPNPELSTAFDRVFITNSKYNQYVLDNLTLINRF